MADSVQMPALGESVTEGTVTRWLKQVGDEVAVDEPLLEVSTDKVDTEIPSPVAGTLVEILVSEDETVEVGTELARIGAAEEAGGDSGGADASEPEPEEPQDEPEEPQDEPEGEPEETEPEPEETEQAEPEQTEEAESQSGGGRHAQASDDGPAEDVPMPALGESVTEGTVTRWLKQVGDEVALDEPLLEISTDKVDTEIPSPVAGTLLEILVSEDETAEVGAPLARIGAGAGASKDSGKELPAEEAEPETHRTVDSESVQEPEERAEQADEPEQAAQKASQSAAEPAKRSEQKRPPSQTGGYLTPLVRKLAAERGVDLSEVTGTGVGGRIRKEDVLEAAEQAEKAKAEKAEKAKATKATSEEAPAKAPAKAASAPAEVSPLRGTTEKASRLRQIIASRMVESMHSMAQLTTVVEVDMTKVARLRTAAKADFSAREGVNLSFLPFFVLAATEALKSHPKINGILEDDQITYHGTENVGIAVDTDRGLVVPVIREAGDLNLAGIARKIADLASRTRANKVTPDELSGATFTVTNTGWGGAVFDTPIVPVGTSAILGTGAIIKRPVVATDPDGVDYIAVRSMCYLALSYDHRLVDGADAARYLAAVKQRLEEGDFESELGL